MTIVYNARVSSSNKQVDGLPMTLPVGTVVKCKIKDVEPLCANCTDIERRWYEEQIVPNIVKEVVDASIS